MLAAMTEVRRGPDMSFTISSRGIRLDVVWEAEFSGAGWIENWTGQRRQQVEQDAVRAALDTATWKGQLVAAPFNSNTQLLWYRKDLVPNPPSTWDQMIAQAEQLASQGKPHFIEIQGASYEGYTVWINAMILSAGGQILSADGQQVILGPPAARAVSVIGRLARSSAADPSLSVQMEDQNRLAFESGDAAFEINYPFIYPSALQNAPKLAKQIGWVEYPRVDAGRPSRPPVGGIDLAVSSYSKHKDQAFDAILCLRNRANQLRNAINGGCRRRWRAFTRTRSWSRAATRSPPRSWAPCSAAASGRRPPPTSRCRSPYSWQYAWTPNTGYLANLLPSGSAPLTKQWPAIGIIILAEIWKTTPFMALLLLAGVSLVPDELLRAAKVDGATAWQRFTMIMLPLMKPAILVALLFRTLDAFRIFDNIFIMTAGANSTRSVSILGYDNLFTALNLGIGSTISVLVFIVVAIIAFIFVKGFGTAAPGQEVARR